MLGALLCVPAAQAQEAAPDSTEAQGAARDTTEQETARPADSLETRPAQPEAARTDSALADSANANSVSADSARADSARAGSAPPDSLIRGPGSSGGGGPGREAGNAIEFSARDSLVIVFGEEDEGDTGTLYGDAEVNRQSITLTAYEVELLFEQGVLRASGPPEGAGADTTGLPRFQRGDADAFSGRALSFNMQTQRGRILEARTQARERDGFVEGKSVQVREDSTLLITGGQYTTCNCPRDQTPSYSLRANKMKKQGDWVYTGPIQLFIYDIPTPLLLPFALLPAIRGRNGGVIPPQDYGRDDDLGLYLRNFGYYWAISDYADLQLTGSLWSRGSWGVSPTFRYKRRYEYDGNLRVNYVRNIVGDVVDQGYQNTTNVNINWAHNQQFTPRQAPNSSSLRARVDLASQTYRQIISDDFQENVKRSAGSNVSFTKNWNNGNQSFDANIRQRQNFTTGNVRLTLPNLSFTQGSFQPFSRSQRGPGDGERWYEKITTRYDGSLENQFNFTPLTDEQLRDRQNLPDSVSSDRIEQPGVAWYDALFSQDAYERATGDQAQRFNFEVDHSIPIDATFRVPRYQLNVTPSLDYNERWLPNTERRELVAVDSTINEDGVQEVEYREVTREEPGFFAEREFDVSLNANTTFYGFFPFRLGALQDLRHEVQPSVGFTYSPDYSTDFFGRTRSYIDADGERVRYDIVSGNTIGGISGRRALSFRIGNEFQTKEVTTDSTGARQERTLRLMTFDASSSYDFKADSLRFRDVRVNARFPALQTKYNINTRAQLRFSPYVYGENGRRISRSVLNETGVFPLSLTDFSVTIGTDFEGGDRENRRGDRFRGNQGVGGAPVGRTGLGVTGGTYANFAIPWSLDLNFSYSFSNRERFEQSNFLLNANFGFNVTPKWKVTGNTGYDFDEGELSPTQLRVTRDFRCWQMNFQWQPFDTSSFGRGASYSFSLNVKSGVLSDLLNLRLPRDDGRGFGDRLRGVASGALQ